MKNNAKRKASTNKKKSKINTSELKNAFILNVA